MANDVDRVLPSTKTSGNLAVILQLCKWIYERSHIRNVETDLKAWLIIAVINVTLAVLKIKAWKKFTPELDLNQSWAIKLSLWIRNVSVKGKKCESCFHIFLRSSNMWSFIYSFVLFPFYRYISWWNHELVVSSFDKPIPSLLAS